MMTRAFTLAEVLVIFSVIGILAAVILPNLNEARVRAQDQERVTYIKQVMVILRTYQEAYGTYPNQTENSILGELATESNLVPEYIASLPQTDEYAYWPVPLVGGTCSSQPTICNTGSQIPKTAAMLGARIEGTYDGKCDPEVGICICYFASSGYDEALPNNQDTRGGNPLYADDGVPWWIEDMAPGGYFPCTEI